jgi:hypothetical protein
MDAQEIGKLISLIEAGPPEEKRGAVEVIRKLLENAGNEMEKYPDTQQAQILPGLCEAFQARHVFKPGQLIKWKKGLKHKRVPRENQPAVVVEVLVAPVFDQERESGSSYFREPLDIIAGTINKEGNMVTYHYDSRRFEPWA